MFPGAACCHCEESAQVSSTEISFPVNEECAQASSTEARLPVNEEHYLASADELTPRSGAEQHGTGQGRQACKDAHLCAEISGRETVEDDQDKEEADDVAQAASDMLVSRSSARTGMSTSCQELELLEKDALKIDVDLLRGIDLRKSLRAAGILWRKSPVDMEGRERTALWTKSRAVKHFDIFLSHTWWTSGRRKVLSLLFQTGLSVSAIWYFVTLALVLALYVLGALPMPGMYVTVSGDEEMTVRLGPFLIICCPAGALLGLLTSPYMPHVLSKPVMCFLDVVSIHQTDEVVKRRGVYGLGGFLKSSTELRILWSEPYLSRLWCVFELAAYRKSNPEGKISFCPLYIETASLLVWLGGVAVASVGWLYVAFAGSGAWMVGSLVLMVLPALPLIHFLRRNNQAKHKLLDDLASFDLNKHKVGCRSDFDRDFVYEAISDWYGSTRDFTEYIRGPLRAELVDKITGSGMPLLYTLPSAGAAITLSLEIGIGMYLAGASAYAMACILVGLTFGFCTLWVPVSIKFLMFLCNHFVMACSSRALDVAQTIVIWLAFTLCFGFGASVAFLAFYIRSLGMASGWAIFASLALWFAFGGARRLGKCCGAGKSSEGSESEEQLDE